MKAILPTLICSFCAGIALQAQITITSDVNKAVQLALHNDIEVTNQSLELQKLELERKSVKAKYIPKIEASALYAYFDSEGVLDIPTVYLPVTGSPLFAGNSGFSAKGNAFHGGITAKAVLFSGGQIYHGAKALEEKNKGTAFMMENRKDEVIKETIESFDQLELLRHAELLINDSEKRLLKETERVEKAIALGLAIPYDRDKIKLATLELDSKRKDVQSKQELLSLKIAQATGLSTAEIRSTVHLVEPIVIMEELTTENRNEIKALESFKKASEFVVKKEKGSLLPTLGAFGGYSYTSVFNAETTIPLHSLNTSANLRIDEFTLHPNLMVGVALKWELFSGFERKHKIDEAKIGLAQVENKLTDAREKLNLQLEKNKITYKNLLNQMEIANQREKIAQNNNTMADKQYKAGLINITERLAAENDIYKESLNKIETIIKQREAAIETYQSAGALTTFLNIQ